MSPSTSSTWTLLVALHLFAVAIIPAVFPSPVVIPLKHRDPYSQKAAPPPFRVLVSLNEKGSPAPISLFDNETNASGPRVHTGIYNQSLQFRKWMSETITNYDNRLRPGFGGKPLAIKLGMFLISISSISEAHMEFTLELFFHETWTDERLKFNPKDFGGTETLTMPLEATTWLWLPDTSFLNALRSIGPEPGSVSHLYYLRLSYYGTIQYSRRLSVTAECQMDLTMYPFDQQACRIELSSYGFTTEDLTYEWALYPNSIPKQIQLQDFYANKHVARVVTKEYVAGNFSVPTFCMIFTRRSGFCFIQLFVPATAVVASSWISLWLQSETQFADMVSIILAIIFLSYSYNTVMPKVSYVKAMDIYLIACFIFAFLSLVKLAIVKYMHVKVNKRKQRIKAASASLMHFPNMIEDLMETATVTVTRINNQQREQQQNNHNNTAEDEERGSNPSVHQQQQQQRQYQQNRTPLLLDKARTGAASAPIPPPPNTEQAHRDRYWRVMRAFHVGSQLVLPLAFSAFGVFYFFIYPSVQKNGGTCD